MKAIAKQHPVPLKLTLEFETLEELQAFRYRRLWKPSSSKSILIRM